MSDYQLSNGVILPKQEAFKTSLNNKKVNLFTIVNKNGMRADVTNYGGRIVSLLVPDNHGCLEDVVTGYHSIKEYLTNDEMFFGALIGRYGNRIANARFVIGDIEYTLDANNGPNSLHGGPGGFYNVVWDVEQKDEQTLKLSYFSADLEEGFPGNLQVEVVYHITNENELSISYKAWTDKPTHVNLTSHAYFNLNGEGNRPIYDHMIRINAELFVPINEKLIPAGHFEKVEGTPFDFTKSRPIGTDIDAVHPQIKIAGGYDHSFVIRGFQDLPSMKLAAEVYHPVSGINMAVLTTEPGLQFYSGNFMMGTSVGKRGELYDYRTAFCLETQHFPDSPNQSGFPSTLLKPGETYETTTIYCFSVKTNTED